MHLGYVNNTSAKSRQIFTLFHELAHLHFHTSGIDKINDSYINNLPDDAQKIEVFCNRFAAKFLVHDDYFWEIFAGKAPNRDIASELASLFKVSREVIYRKFLDRQLIDQQEYIQATESWSAEMTKRYPIGYIYGPEDEPVPEELDQPQ